METFTISIDSSQAAGNCNFQIELAGAVSLTNISKVEILRASIYTASNASAVYVYIDELAANHSNMRIAQLGQSSPTFDNSKLKGAIISWNPSTSPRTTFMTNTHWESYIIYDKPKDSLTTLTVSLYDQLGNALPEMGSDITYLTLRFTCNVPVPVPPSIPEVPVIAPNTSTYRPPRTSPYIIPRYSIYIILAILLAIGSRFFFSGASSFHSLSV